MAFSSKYLRNLSILPQILMLGGCLGSDESVGSSSASVQTSIVPASVPYYLDLCGQAPDKTYRLYAPAAMGDWRAGVGESDPATAAADRLKCVRSRRIDNGDPITVRLHRVGVGGLAKFDAAGKCTKGCKRDVAVVLDFNGSATLQKPIVAFYQKDVAPDSNLQFINQIIYSQNEWFYRYPPSFRVRLYDVRDDKDAALRGNLETVKKAASLISQYIAGAAIAGPIIDTAVSAADQLISGPRNRSIMDMSFQLFPDEQQDDGRKEEIAGGVVNEAAKAQAAAARAPAPPSGATLSESEVKALQSQLGLDRQQQDGKLGRYTLRTLLRVHPDLSAQAPQSDDFNKAVRALIVQPPAPDTRLDDTFGSRIYASQFIVFDEGAKEGGSCADPSANVRARIGTALPSYRFAPDGVRYGGARVYTDGSRGQCVLEASFVTFSITKESANVAADVAKRISDLQTKFTANQAVGEDAVAALTATRVDAELALAIDRVENMRRPDRLRAMIMKLGSLKEEAQASGNAERSAPPMPGAAYRSRSYRLIEDYLGCPVSDQTTVEQFKGLADELSAAEWQAVKRRSAKPYFVVAAPATLECPGTPTVADPEPPTVPPAPPAQEVEGAENT
ncbi:hypothetical protein [Sphingomonas hylomeconis]|uniref:Lipoprotein n=1 Tax=Sphingomonas hylomeconis TaxID=1395958 RepID=A0ABV7SUA3_9SPHN|nr:hypothetical protein [Sphingomonas hylomeconis]